MWLSNTNNAQKTEKNVFKDFNGQIDSGSNWTIIFSFNLISSYSLYTIENIMAHFQPYDHLKVTHLFTTKTYAWRHIPRTQEKEAGYQV